jgi:hypothetical protein
MKILLMILLLAGWKHNIKPPMGTPIDRTNSITDDMTGCWVAGHGFMDLTGNGHDGIGLVNTLPGPSGMCWDFDGTASYIDCGNAIDLEMAHGSDPAPMTLLVWFKADYVPPTAPEVDSIVSKYDHDNDDYGYIIFLYNNLIFVRLNEAAGGLHSVSTAFTDTSDWHHIVLLYNFNADFNLQMFLDGVEAGTAVNTDSTQNKLTADHFFIGRDEAAGGNYFNGQIDSVLLYDRSLTPAEINKLYRQRYCYFADVDMSILESAIAAPTPPTGQVILIQMSAVPVIVLLGCLLYRHSERKAG